MKWNDVTEDQKKKLIEKFRDVNVDSSWWHDQVISDFKSDMLALGFVVQDVQFSGFWCQGDGASFRGYVGNAVTFMASFFTGQYPMLHKWAASGQEGIGDLFTVTRARGHYSHSGYMSIESAEEPPSWVEYPAYGDDLDPMVVAAREVWNKEIDAELATFIDDVKDLLRSKADQLYKDLETEYEHQTADEQVWDCIVNNYEPEDLIDDDED